MLPLLFWMFLGLSVNAGPDQRMTFQSCVVDDGRCQFKMAGKVTTTEKNASAVWALLSGSESVRMSSEKDPKAVVSVDKPGVYVFLLVGADAKNVQTDSVRIEILGTVAD